MARPLAFAMMNLNPLLACPPTVTTTLPVDAPFGIVTAMLVGLQLVAVAVVPLKVTILLPCADPKLTPLRVSVPPGEPATVDRLVISGAVAGLVAGKTSTAAKSNWLVGWVSFKVTLVPLAGTVVFNCCAHPVSVLQGTQVN